MKALATRLKGIMPVIISDNKSVFVQGRLITNNVLIGFECMHWLKQNKSSKNPIMAVKLDISKAYDRMERAYLEDVF